MATKQTATRRKPPREITRGVRFDQETAGRVKALAERRNESFSSIVLAATIAGLSRLEREVA